MTGAGSALFVMNFHATPRFPRGFRNASRNCGIKPEGRDLSLFVSDVDAAAAAVFTRNRFPGAPILLGRETIRAGVLRAVVVNSRVSNVATGEEGLANARRMAAAAAAELGTDPSRVLVSSTGVIGVPLPIDRIESGLRGMAAELVDNPLVGAEGIMTTDTHPKALSMTVGDATLTIVAKGSGMIEPNMATMLAYVFTDARMDAGTLDVMLRDAVDGSFNMLSVDTDTSTSDTCAILANGLAGTVDPGAWSDALHAACVRMTEILARDGEGATKLLRATVRGAASLQEARLVAKTLVNSPLIKTMAYGADPNVGRILMAVGKCFDAGYEPARVGASINGFVVVENGSRARFEDARVRAELAGDVVDLEVDLGGGGAEATAYGCDLTEGYVRENAAYYSS
ncbi:MAG TPA: bifunctional glutamate N-acetyltransferase/amino-acid acetyltransferase ArgJ [Longimicrobiales bacterium]|nr:bifunctional glutamate N-acetyltransferase/amino-acid acetyltransferase ArgJ [Longimicrobiales bacterium]